MATIWIYMVILFERTSIERHWWHCLFKGTWAPLIICPSKSQLEKENLNINVGKKDSQSLLLPSFILFFNCNEFWRDLTKLNHHKMKNRKQMENLFNEAAETVSGLNLLSRVKNMNVIRSCCIWSNRILSQAKHSMKIVFKALLQEEKRRHQMMDEWVQPAPL